MKKKRIVIYARVSTLDQNPDMQLRELRAYAKRAGFVVAAELVDRISSKKETRKWVNVEAVNLRKDPGRPTR